MPVTSINPLGVLPGLSRAQAVLRERPESDEDNRDSRPVDRMVEPGLRIPTTADVGEAPPAEGETEDAEQVPGVIRLLEAGHFRGVADVRLRTIFFDQLAARAQERGNEAVQENAGQLVRAISERVEQTLAPLAEQEDAIAGLRTAVEEFGAGVQTAVEDAVSTTPLDQEALRASLETTFDAFVEQVQSLLVPVAPPESIGEPEPVPVEPPVDEAPADEVDRTESDASLRVSENDVAAPAESTTTDPGDEAPTTELDDAIALLREAFADALSTLIASIEEAVRRPDPAPPTGNGMAYGMFLEQYNALRGVSTGTDSVA